MNWDRILTVARKEWDETIRNTTIVSTFLIMVVIFTGWGLWEITSLERAPLP